MAISELNNCSKENRNSKWFKSVTFIIGLGALIWFLIRGIPKPSRATYPCQRAAFPIASSFVIWLTGTLTSLFAFRHLKTEFKGNRTIGSLLTVAMFATIIGWLTFSPTENNSLLGANEGFVPAVGYDWKPGESNKPIGTARGIFPGRVVMSRNPEATKWAGNWRDNNDQWWLDKNTDIGKISEMLSATLQKLTGAKNDSKAWDKIFKYYNKNSRSIKRGYENNEIVAVKINLNNSSGNDNDNQTDATPQMVLAMVKQLVLHAEVPEKNIVVFDARRTIAPFMIKTIWKEFPNIRFVQEREAVKEQPLNPLYNSHQGIETSNWQEGIEYSKGNFKEAKLIPQQIIEATYLVNLALLKSHSYPYNFMEDGVSGETGVTLCAKNHFGSIKAPWELHAAINPTQDAKPNSYSPLVDLSASPNLGAKTILFVLDGLYSGRKWRSYPIHFPNHPFNNQTEPYENPEWPACMLVSLDQVALESVGLDILYAQSKNNIEKSYHNVPRIMIRDNASDYLKEMADPQNAPSGTNYIQEGKPVTSLGVFEHWDSDSTMRYSRNIDPKNGQGIEFIYIPMEIN